MKTAYDTFKEAFDREPNPPLLNLTVDDVVEKMKKIPASDYQSAWGSIGLMMIDNNPIMRLIAGMAIRGADANMRDMVTHFKEQQS